METAMYMRREVIGDSKVNVTEQPVDVLPLARAIAEAKNMKDNDEAFMIINLDALYERFKLWKRELPQIEPFYAVKCNSDETMVQALAALGVGFDCASREEIDIVMRMGVAQERIIYANPCKTRSFIAHAEEKGVTMMTFDNAEELEKIAKHHKCPELILRIAVSDPTATCPLNLKFGAEPVKQAPELLKRAADLGIAVIGVSFHVGSGCNDPSAYRVALGHARNLFDLGLGLGHKMEIVDIGGGFPGGEHHTPFEQIAALIRSAVGEFFPEPEVRLIAEPGRFFAARPFTLVANVIAHTAVPAEKITKNACDAAATGHMYYINDGVYGSFNCILFDHAHPTGRPLFDIEGEKYPSTIWGPTCDSLDQIEDKKMMRALDVGDWLIYEVRYICRSIIDRYRTPTIDNRPDDRNLIARSLQDMGAYTCAASTTFNGFQRPTPIYVIGERTWKALGM
ncbi:odc-1 [Pristionchus pacificus]|uniref:ornithine decarboxylase n=1 Tax=Pristionchus pacificus TaxID=54126 RepID=A0A2A6C1Q8_PRIPA|nr:odc-1 [Pristionchus pacificus]|eukprot:PDM72039.1 odc-1 [Pristionchus pacificus]